jgi:hypothetical protein
MLFDFARPRAPGLLRALLLAGALGLPATILADPLAVSRWTVDGGGTGFVAVGSFIVGGTIGQPDAGLLSGTGFSIAGGFWIPGAPSPVGVGGEGDPDAGTAPLVLAIYPASPNPLRTFTRIVFELPDERMGQIQVFDVRGALRRTLASGRFAPGRHLFEWDGLDSGGRRVGAGLYLVRVRLGALERSQKLVVLR